jgi:hypothetical protein
MHSVRSTINRRSAALAIPLLLGGCAALQIDVDVYKGPLVNNEEIQHQQVISMALSAKMLMIAARNQFIEAALNPQPTGSGKATQQHVLEGKQFFEEPAAAGAKVGNTRLSCERVNRLDPHATHLCQKWQPSTHYEQAKQCFSKVYDRSFLTSISPLNDVILQKRMRMAIQLNDLLSFYPKTSANSRGILPQREFPCEFSGNALDNAASNGHDKDGIDGLADLVLRTNEALITAKSSEINVILKNSKSPESSADSKATLTSAQTALQDKTMQADLASAKLERTLADVASRMQFLATNQWLVDDSKEEESGNYAPVSNDQTNRYKALFEAIANTILLHVDDIQNRRKFEKQTIASQQTERQAYKKVWGSEVENLTATKSIEVIDALIAELRYRHLQALAGGSNGKIQAAALEEARRQRSLMIYLRPSSAYLRSVFATTYTQQDPGLAWQNLLNDRVKDLLNDVPLVRNPFKVENPKVRQVRADLDKVFWQNINTVRVSGAGSTNFVVAKDDVGNWYVKSMGADPEAMIKAATNTALFSYSGRIDTNLFRMAELRNRLDTKGLDDDQYARARQELNDYRTTNSGPAAAAHGQTWSLFENNYRKQGDAQLAQMKAQIKQNVLPTELTRRWTDTLQSLGDDARTKLIAGFLGQTAVKKAMAEAIAAVDPPKAATSVVVPPEASTPAASPEDPSESLLLTLEALHRYQGTLRAQVLAEKTLTGAAAAQLTEAENARTNAERTLETALREVASTEADLKATENAVEVGSVKLTAARNAHVEARNRMTAATKELTTQRTAVSNANNTLAAATARRDALLTDLDIVVGQYIRSEGGKRMRANEEMETAARIVGQSVSPTK